MTELSNNFMIETIDKIEVSYEFMLAYAAQGNQFENANGDSSSIRSVLDELEDGLRKIIYAIAEKIEAFGLPSGAFNAMEDFKDVLAGDAGAALKALRVVQTAPSINSELVGCLNDSVDLECLLTNIYIIDKALLAHIKE